MISLQYLAGFFDGEGCIGIYKNGEKNYYLTTQLAQNCGAGSKIIFDEMINRFGGACHKQNTISGG